MYLFLFVARAAVAEAGDWNEELVHDVEAAGVALGLFTLAGEGVGAFALHFDCTGINLVTVH